jgi:hypothetical protein
MIRILLILIPAVILISSCAMIPVEDVSDYISQYSDSDPEPSSFTFCYNHGCSRVVTVHLNSDQWNDARKIFQQLPDNGAEERQCISLVIGVLETIVGKVTGEYKSGGSGGWIASNKLDCVDDAVNTSTYLYMLRKEGLIRFHEIRGPAHRGFLIDGKWPHVATVIIEKKTGDAFVVDSWFLDNGHPAFVIPFKDWSAGWKPGEAKKNIKKEPNE